jgi:hypothetical protein
MTRSLSPLSMLWERFILSAALRQLEPTHPAVPLIVRRLADQENAPSPMDPADSVVTGACVLAAMFLGGMALLGWLPGGV